jgi:periplasmic protein TonB
MRKTLFDPPARPKGKLLTRLAIAAIALLAAVAIFYVVKGLMTDSGGKKKKTVHQIAILKPPPPPPPPKVEPKPPEIKKEQVKIEQPKPQDTPQPKEAPVSETLKMDTPGTGPGDNFGIQAGQGKDITTIGGGSGGTGTGGVGGGGNRAQYAFYVNLIKRHFDDELAKNRKLRASDYRIIVNVWLSRDGRIQRYELAGSSGNADTDELLKSTLSAMSPLPEPPPEAMPQPVRLRITARGTG